MRQLGGSAFDGIGDAPPRRAGGIAVLSIEWPLFFVSLALAHVRRPAAPQDMRRSDQVVGHPG